MAGGERGGVSLTGDVGGEGVRLGRGDDCGDADARRVRIRERRGNPAILDVRDAFLTRWRRVEEEVEVG